MTILVDGELRFSGPVRPTLVTAFKSYDRRRDWGLIYLMSIEVRLDE